MFKEEMLTCKDCGQEFAFTAAEQEFYAGKGFTNKPGRCPQCRAARKSAGRASGSGYGRGERQFYPAVCSACGQKTEVPFKPNGDKPVYCSDCFRTHSRRSW